MIGRAFEYVAKPSVDLASGVIRINEFQSAPLDDDRVKRLAKQLCTQVVETRNRAIRAGLIRLGWTPPECELKALAVRLRASLVAAKKQAEGWLDDGRGTTFDDDDEWWVEANKALADSADLEPPK